MTANGPEPARARPPERPRGYVGSTARFCLRLTRWPVLIGVGLSIVVVLLTKGLDLSWLVAAILLPVIVITPAVGLSSLIGCRLARTRYPGLVFIVVPLGAFLIAVGIVAIVPLLGWVIQMWRGY